MAFDNSAYMDELRQRMVTQGLADDALLRQAQAAPALDLGMDGGQPAQPSAWDRMRADMPNGRAADLLLTFGLSMLGNNRKGASFGNLVAQAGADTMGVWNGWKALQEQEARRKEAQARADEQLAYDRAQKERDWEWKQDDRDYSRWKDERDWQAQEAARRDAQAARWAGIARQDAAARQAAEDAAKQAEYQRTHRMGEDGQAYVLDESGDKPYWKVDEDAYMHDDAGNRIGMKPESAPEMAKQSDAVAMGKWYDEQTKDYNMAGQYLTNLHVGARQENATGDLDMIFSLMKMYDPTSVVREGEQASAQNAAGVPTRIQNIYNNLLSGTRLSPEQRREFVQIGYDLYAKQAQKKQGIDRRFEKRAADYNITTPIIYDDYAEIGDEVGKWLSDWDANQDTKGSATQQPGTVRRNATGRRQYIPGKERWN